MVMFEICLTATQKGDILVECVRLSRSTQKRTFFYILTLGHKRTLIWPFVFCNVEGSFVC